MRLAALEEMRLGYPVGMKLAFVPVLLLPLGCHSIVHVPTEPINIGIGQDDNDHTAWTGYIELSDPGVDQNKLFTVVVTWLSGMDMKDNQGKKSYPRKKVLPNVPLGETKLPDLFYGNGTHEGVISARVKGQLSGASFPMHRPPKKD